LLRGGVKGEEGEKSSYTRKFSGVFTHDGYSNSSVKKGIIKREKSMKTFRKTGGLNEGKRSGWGRDILKESTHKLLGNRNLALGDETTWIRREGKKQEKEHGQGEFVSCELKKKENSSFRIRRGKKGGFHFRGRGGGGNRRKKKEGGIGGLREDGGGIDFTNGKGGSHHREEGARANYSRKEKRT